MLRPSLIACDLAWERHKPLLHVSGAACCGSAVPGPYQWGPSGRLTAAGTRARQMASASSCAPLRATPQTALGLRPSALGATACLLTRRTRVRVPGSHPSINAEASPASAMRASQACARAQDYYREIANAVLNEQLLAEMVLTHAGAVASTLQMPLALTGSAAGVASGAGMQGMLLGHAGGLAGGALAGGPLAGTLLPFMQNPGLQHAGNLARPMYPGAHLGPQFAPQARPRSCVPEQLGAAGAYVQHAGDGG